VRRRDFIALLGGAVAARPLIARAQQSPMPVIGFLTTRSPADTTHLVAAFRKGLGEVGFVEGQNVAIEYRFALGQFDRMPALAAELVRRRVSVLAATGGEPSAYAAKAATATIPIVFTIGGDPVQENLATSLSRPGGNITGITLLTNLLEPKRLDVLHHMVPAVSTIGFLLNPSFPPAASQLADMQQAARASALQVQVLRANTDREIDAAFAAMGPRHVAAIAVAASPFFDTRREKLVGLAARYAIPTLYQFREYAMAGGLASYGIDVVDAYRQAGVYTGRVLNGAKPADLPVLRADKFEFVINLKTARALGLALSPSVLALADEVIE
jgi:ABC-type uncharacterized transport system substrate-binding protein